MIFKSLQCFLSFKITVYFISLFQLFGGVQLSCASVFLLYSQLFQNVLEILPPAPNTHAPMPDFFSVYWMFMFTYSISRIWKICKYRMEGAGLSKGNNNNCCFSSLSFSSSSFVCLLFRISEISAFILYACIYYLICQILLKWTVKDVYILHNCILVILCSHSYNHKYTKSMPY